MPTAERNPASAPLFIINPLSGQRMDNLFSTHPNVENRIRALEAMAGRREPDARAGARPADPDPAEPDPRRPPPLRVARPGLAARRAAAALVAGVLERGGASASRPRRRTGRWRRWRRPSGRGRRRWRRARSGISGGSTRVLAPFLQEAAAGGRR